jgi:hypothetical protein
MGLFVISAALARDEGRVEAACHNVVRVFPQPLCRGEISTQACPRAISFSVNLCIFNDFYREPSRLAGERPSVVWQVDCDPIRAVYKLVF